MRVVRRLLPTLSDEEILQERMARQGLAERPARSVLDAVRRGAGLQAQDAAAARLGVRARAVGLDEDAVAAALQTHRSVVRTWAMRATVHLLAADDLRWMTRLLGPMIRRRFETVRWPALGLTATVLDRASDLAPSVLAAGPLPRMELLRALVDRGLDVAVTSEVATHLALFLSSVGLICRGPERGRDASVVAVSSWLPDAPEGPSGDEGLAELARRYFAAFSPATAADFTVWSGLPSAHAVEMVRDELSPVTVRGRPGFRLATCRPARGVRLLPAFDNALLGHRDRDALLPADRRGEVYVGGIIRPTVMRDGQVVGRWRLARGRRGVEVVVVPFGSLRGLRSALDAEVADVGRFLGHPAEWRIES
jgi:hypothetical protein